MSPRDETLLLVGAGAVKGAWTPVVSSLREIGFHDLATPDGATFAMARLVYFARMACLRADDALGKHRAEVIGELAEARRAVAKALIRAEALGELTIRPEFERIVREVVLPSTRSVRLVTTNWDTIVEKAAGQLLPGIETFYVHGSVASPEHLYLPTEIVEEPFRERSEFSHLNNARARMVRAIDESTRLVIYGLAVSALDVELGEVIATGLHDGHVREICIINPSYVEVAERIATFGKAGSPELPIYCLSPFNLSERWIFERDQVEAERERVSETAKLAGPACFALGEPPGRGRDWRD